jgi:hypothetical protein
MNDIRNILDIDIESKEGKMLVAAIAVLTTLKEEDLANKKWGRSLNANNVLVKLSDLTNTMFANKYRTEGIKKTKVKRHLDK